MSLALAPVEEHWPGLDGEVQFNRLPGIPERQYYSFIPQTIRPGSVPLVLVHGISRNASEIILRFSDLADQLGVPLIAPLFEKRAFGMYQQVVDPKRGTAADQALFDILRHAQGMWGIETERFDLLGFSGGAQFAHRFALLHPNSVRSCVPVSAGWYTWPDHELNWPMGLAGPPQAEKSRSSIAMPAYHIVVGQRDTANDAALRRSVEIDQRQGDNRLERAKRWHRAMQDAGLNDQGSLTVLPRTRHNFSRAEQNGLAEMSFSLLGYPAVAERHEQ